jgi:hypothetical protein
LVEITEVAAAIITIFTSLGIGSGVYWKYWVKPEIKEKSGRHDQLLKELKDCNDSIDDVKNKTKEVKDKVECIDEKVDKVRIWLRLQCPPNCKDQWNAVFPNDKIT